MFGKCLATKNKKTCKAFINKRLQVFKVLGAGLEGLE